MAALRKVGFLRGHMTLHGMSTGGEFKGRLIIAWLALELLVCVRVCFRESGKDHVTWCGAGLDGRAVHAWVMRLISCRLSADLHRLRYRNKREHECSRQGAPESGTVKRT